MAFVIGSGVFAIDCIGDTLILAVGGSPWLAVIDDLCIGAFAAVLVYSYERRRSQELRRRLTVVAQMNHHVRNQLEIIEMSAWTTHDKAHIGRLHKAVGHIDWALREILGHRYVEAAAPLPPPKPPVAVRQGALQHEHQSAD